MPTQSAVKAALSSNGKSTRESVSIQTVTPKTAQAWLEGNVDNRSLREPRVLHLSKILERGEWELTGDAIVFDEYGTLLNGQHRLTAIVVTGISARLLVLKGVPPKAQEAMDQGLSRTLGDQLQRRGVPYYTYVSSALFWLHRLEYAEETSVAHYSDPSLRPTFRQLLVMLDENPELPDEAPRIGRHVSNLKVRAGATLAIYHRLKKIEDDNIDAEVDLFFDKWLTGAELKASDPIWRLREWTVDDAQRRHTKGRAPDYRFAAYVLTAWNKWRDGEPVRQIKWTYTPTTRMAWPIPH